MNPFHQQIQCGQFPSDFSHYSHPTEKQDETSAWEAIHQFFDYYGLDGAEENFWGLVLAAIGSDDLNDDSLIRHNLLDFYDQARSLFKAVYLLCQRRED